MCGGGGQYNNVNFMHLNTDDLYSRILGYKRDGGIPGDCIGLY